MVRRSSTSLWQLSSGEPVSRQQLSNKYGDGGATRVGGHKGRGSQGQGVTTVGGGGGGGGGQINTWVFSDDIRRNDSAE